MSIFKEEKSAELVCRKSSTNGLGRLHWHQNIEICQVLSETSLIYVDGERIEAKQGDIVVMSEFAVHSYSRLLSESVVRFCQFPVDILLNSGVMVLPIKTHIKKSEIKEIPELEHKINCIFDFMKNEESCVLSSDNPFFLHISAALYFLLMQNFPSDDNKTAHKSERREFYEIVDYINNNFTADVTVERLSKKFCVSRGKLSAVFKKFSDTTVNEYVNNLRVNNVNKLIENGYIITEAALESGFSSIRNFNVVYQKVMGMTPSEYKNKSKLKGDAI